MKSARWCVGVVLAVLGLAMLGDAAVFNCTLQSNNPQLEEATGLAIDAAGSKLVSSGSSTDYCTNLGQGYGCGRFTLSSDGGVGWTNMTTTQYGLTSGPYNITEMYTQICSSASGTYILAAGDGPIASGIIDNFGTGAFSSDGGLSWTAVPLQYGFGRPYGSWRGCAMSAGTFS